MTTIHATFDLTLYPAPAVVRAVHRFSGSHAGHVERSDNIAKVTLTPRAADAPDVVADLCDAVIDEALRELVHARTANLHETLIAAAFGPVKAAP